MGTVLLAVTFMATISSRQTADENAAAPALQQQPAPAPAQTGQPAAFAPIDVARSVFAPAKPIESARFNIRFNATELAGSRERQALRLTGRFQSADGKVPSFDIRASEVTDGKATHDHVLSTGDKGYVFSGVTALTVGERTMAGLNTFREAIAKGTVGANDQLKEPDPASWLVDLKSKKAAKIDGVETSHITAVIAPKMASADVLRVVRSVAAATDEPVGLPGQLGKKVQRALKTARLEAWVGTEDRIVRRLSIDVRGAFPAEVLQKGESARWHMGLDVNLSQVNKPQKIETPGVTDPAGPAKGLSKKQARSGNGIFALGALFTDPPASVVKTAVALAQTSERGRAMRKPRAVSRAVANRQRVVIFFRQPGGLDDAATDAAVVALRKRDSAVVFQDVITNVANYGQVVMSVGVTRAPSIVIIGSSGRARLLEGFIDPGALAQEVADTR